MGNISYTIQEALDLDYITKTPIWGDFNFELKQKNGEKFLITNEESFKIIKITISKELEVTTIFL
jgi:hypothetical protein